MGKEHLFGNWAEQLTWIHCGLKILTKSLYLTQLIKIKKIRQTQIFRRGKLF